MDVKSGGFRSRLGSAPFVFLVFFLLPIGSANATGSIGRQAANFCSPAMTSPDVGSCQACHTSNNESKNDLNAAGRQARSGNFAFFCPTPAPAPMPTPGTGTGTGSAGGAMGTGMTGMSGMSGMRGMRGMGSRRVMSSRFRRHHDDDDDDDDDDRKKKGDDDDDD
jgi:hypothetical protein